MTLSMGPLIVEAADPGAVADFWAAALGPSAQRALLSFRPQARPKTVKNRVHLDVYVNAVEPLLKLGATVLAEYRPERVTLADVEGNEFCAFLDPALDGDRPARSFAVCTDSDRPEELAAWWAPQVGAKSAMDRTGLRAGSMGQRVGKTSSGSSSTCTTNGWCRIAGSGVCKRIPADSSTRRATSSASGPRHNKEVRPPARPAG